MVRALLLALVALAIAAPAASAHATLEATSPASGAVLKAEPKQVVFRFNEPVEGTFGALRVFDAKGRRVDDNRVSHPRGAGTMIAVGLRSNVRRGAYSATLPAPSSRQALRSTSAVSSCRECATGYTAAVRTSANTAATAVHSGRGSTPHSILMP